MITLRRKSNEGAYVMRYRNLAQLFEICKTKSRKKSVALVCAEDEHSLEAIMRASLDGYVSPVLIGKKDAIEQHLESFGGADASVRIVPADGVDECVSAAVELVHKGEVGAIMKGLMQTADLMRAVVSKENGLRTDRKISHLEIKEIPNYHKIICITDVAVNTYPDVEGKKGMILNAVEAMNAFGCENPKVAVLCAVDTVNPKMPETVEAAELKRLNVSGEIPGCIVEGPIPYDLALYQEAVDIKGYESPVAADADILVLPDIHAANIFVKALELTANIHGGGFIVGAKVPLILTSRASPVEEKYNSIVLASAI